jgi:hypothetical protein
MPTLISPGYNPFTCLRENSLLLLALQAGGFHVRRLRSTVIQVNEELVEVRQEASELSVIVRQLHHNLSLVNRWSIAPHHQVEPLELSLAGLELALIPVTHQVHQQLADWFRQVMGCLLQSQFPTSPVDLKHGDHIYQVSLSDDGVYELKPSDSEVGLLQITKEGEIYYVSPKKLCAQIDPFYRGSICTLIA